MSETPSASKDPPVGVPSKVRSLQRFKSLFGTSKDKPGPGASYVIVVTRGKLERESSLDSQNTEEIENDEYLTHVSNHFRIPDIDLEHCDELFSPEESPQRKKIKVGS